MRREGVRLGERLVRHGAKAFLRETRMVRKFDFGVQYFLDPREAGETPFDSFAAMGGGGEAYHSPERAGGTAVESPKQPLRLVLDEAVTTYGSVEDLGGSLTARINDMIESVLREIGFAVASSETPSPVVERSYEKARAGLAGLMARARENLVVTITRRGDAGEAVALVDWRALKIILDLADEGLKGRQQFGDLVTEFVDPDTAAGIAELEIHKPLPDRQSAAERRRLRNEFARDGI